MQTILYNMRQVIGTPAFYNAAGNLDYGAVCEYMIAGILAIVAVTSFLKLVIRWCSK